MVEAQYVNNIERQCILSSEAMSVVATSLNAVPLSLVRVQTPPLLVANHHPVPFHPGIVGMRRRFPDGFQRNYPLTACSILKIGYHKNSSAACSIGGIKILEEGFLFSKKYTYVLYSTRVKTPRLGAK